MRADHFTLDTGDQRLALFLDFDGTLVDLAPRPDLVVVSAATQHTLARVQTALDGAVAIISGRDIAEIDAHLAPRLFAVSGVHGLTRRAADGTCAAIAPDLDTFNPRVTSVLTPLLNADAHLRLEHKTGGVALHYRGARHQAAACDAAMEAAARDVPGVIVRRGKDVVEMTRGAETKGTAVTAFLAEHPFHGRTPVFFGDDATDEDAFAVVNARGGLSIKVGAGATIAQQRLPDPAAVLAWLDACAARRERTSPCRVW